MKAVKGYIFEKNIDIEKLIKSIKFVKKNIPQLKNKKLKIITKKNKNIIEIKKEYIKLHKISYKHSEEIVFKLVKNKNQFFLGIIIDHSICDAASVNYVINKIIEIYKEKNIKGELKSVINPEIKSFINNIQNRKIEQVISKDKLSNFTTLINNVENPVYDKEIKKKDLKKFKNNKKIKVYEFGMEKINNIQSKNPNISKNSILSALICKAYSKINKINKFSFYMMLRIDNYNKKEYCLGNYVVAVPIHINTDKKIENVANEIKEQIMKFKNQELEYTSLVLGEKLDYKNLPKFRDPYTFTISNCTDYEIFDKNIEMKSSIITASINPINENYANYVTKQAIAITINKENIMIAFSPSIIKENDISDLGKVLNDFL